MGRKIIVDPITRIEGHLRIDVEVEAGSVQSAWSSGQMWRGIEVILKGRDPREAWLFTQRICGVCTTVHAIASVRAVENALKLDIPTNAQLVRNLLIAAHSLHDHIVHFYHLSALDWVDVVSALSGDPRKAAAIGQSLSPWKGNTVETITAVKEKLRAYVERGQLGIFTNGYWGHPAMRLSPDVNLLAVTHYLQALEAQRSANKAVAILGSKTPNIQNLCVGGITNTIDPDDENGLNMKKLAWVRELLAETAEFVQQVYVPDVCAIGAMYADWLGYGQGVLNYLAVPDLPVDGKATSFALPGGTIMNGDLATVQPITSFGDDRFRTKVSESIARAWYDGDWDRHPWDEETVPKPGEHDPAGRYSWVKAPRFDGAPMQVGPLAQVLVGYASGHEPSQRWTNAALGLAGTVAGAKLGPEVLHSTLGRHAARAVRAAMLSEMALEHWQKLVDNIESGDRDAFNQPVFPQGEQRGFGFHEAPRGTLSHWIVIQDGKIANYQCVVPSTWNAGPRDAKDQMGPYEASLVGNPIADEERPLEVLRTIHSFDPCLACAIHAHDPQGKSVFRVKVM